MIGLIVTSHLVCKHIDDAPATPPAECSACAESHVNLLPQNIHRNLKIYPTIQNNLKPHEEKAEIINATHDIHLQPELKEPIFSSPKL